MPGWVWRRGWVVVVTTAAVAIISVLLAQARQTTYAADVTFLVGSGASDKGPGSVYEAGRLAATYAQLIPKDDAVLAGASQRLGTSPAEVQDRLSVFTVPDTSLLKVRYTAGDSESALAGATAVAQTIQLDPAVYPTIPQNSLTPSDLPTARDVITQGGSVTSSTVPIGLLLGFALGVLLVLAWERTDKRVERGDDLAVATGTPSLVVDDLAGPAAQVLLRRWAAAHPTGRPAVVALVASGSRGAETTRAVATRLAALGQPMQVRVASTTDVLAGGPHLGGGDLVLLPAGRPGGQEDGEAAASLADVVVLVTVRGESAAHVHRVVEGLGRYDLAISWGLLSARRNRTPSSHRADPPPPAHAPVDPEDQPVRPVERSRS